MELTHFDKAFRDAIKELNMTAGRAYVLENFLSQTKKRIETDIQVGHDLMTAGFPFRDVTLDKGTNNLFMPSDYYKLNRLNLSEETEMIVSRECLFYISQAYEILETYLYNQVAEFINLNNQFHLFIDAKLNLSTFESIRKGLRLLDDRKNNRHLLRIIRANSLIFANSETTNIYDRNYKEWFEMLSEIRHCITHKRMILTSDFIDNFTESYELYFEVREYENHKILYMNYSNCASLLSNIGEFIFLVYKSIVETCYCEKVDFKTITPIFSEHLSFNQLASFTHSAKGK